MSESNHCKSNYYKRESLRQVHLGRAALASMNKKIIPAKLTANALRRHPSTISNYILHLLVLKLIFK